MKKIDFNVYVNVAGEFYTEDEDIRTPDDLVGAIFNEEANCEVWGIVTDPNHMPLGYMDIEEVDDEEYE